MTFGVRVRGPSAPAPAPVGRGRRRRVLARVSAVGLLTLGFGMALGLGFVGLDASERSLPGPGWLVGWVNGDDTRYSLHAALGSALNRLGGPPSVAATQWVKAAAHVRSQADLRRAAAGIA